MSNMRFIKIAMLPKDNNVRKVLHQDIIAHRKSGNDNAQFFHEECRKMFGAYEATGCLKYHRCYQIMTEMMNRQRQ